MKISKRVKRIFSLVLAFVLLMSTNMEILYADNTTVADVNVFFDAGNFNNGAQVNLVLKDGSTLTNTSVGDMFTPGTKIGDKVASLSVTAADGTQPLGWHACKKVQVVDPVDGPIFDSSGNPLTQWQSIDGVMYDEAGVLAYTVPSDCTEFAFVAQWNTGNAGNGSQGGQMPTLVGVEFWSNYPGAQVLLTKIGDQALVGENVGTSFTVGSTIGSQISQFSVTNPNNATLIGWNVYELVYAPNTDPNTRPSISSQTQIATLNSTDDVMAYVVPASAEAIAFEAKWDASSTPVTPPSQGPTTSVKFILQDGTITLFSDGPMTDYITSLVAGKTVKESLAQNANFIENKGGTVTDPEYWTTTRAFEGWKVYTHKMTTDENGNSVVERVQVENTGLLSTADMMNFKVPEYQIEFEAQWAGNDEDYYTDVMIDGHGQEITVEEEEWIGPGQTQKVERKYFGIGDYFRQTGDGMRWQMDNLGKVYFKAEPVKEGATLEGWLEYRIIEYSDHSEMKLVSDKLYSTTDMLNRPIPADKTQYVAKWSDIPYDEYPGFGQNAGSDSGSQNSWGNLFMYAGGGNFDYKFIRDNDEVIEQKGMGLFVYNIDDNKTFKQCMDEKHDGLTAVYKECSTLKGWTLYTCDDVEYLYVPAGQDPAIGDPDLTMLYLFESDGQDCWVLLTNAVKADGLQTTDVIYNLSDGKEYFAMPAWDDAHTPGNTTIENTVDPTASQDGSYEKVDYCKVCNKELSRIKETLKMTTQPVVLTGALAGKTGRVETKSALTEIPETISEKYNTVDAIQDEMIKKTEESNKNFANNKDVKTKLLDVELKVQKEDGTWEVVDPDNFPAEGITFLITYEELGISNPGEYDFVITHMITHGAKAGEVEVLSYTREAAGLRVKTTSLSPIMVSSVGKEETPWYSWFYTTPEGTTAATAGSAVVTSPKTGDNSALMYLMMLAATGVVITFAARKKAR